ncbi:peptidoglycan editing factor PgeF [Halonatronum saccharophilum]|uniref:peptidoglycan editing factor PgeF n=1 Tax=Halonatronum saccharophilum TaxID=150060 RepID=UPI0009FF856E|nr:peptidoglycan editing factor PgeF [Halonatronum saccharophilum]
MLKIFKLKEKSGIRYYIIEELAKTGLVDHCFTTKIGGVSKGDYQSLNMGQHVDDDLEKVNENRRRVGSILKADLKDMVAAKQIHDNKVYIVSDKDKGRGALDYKGAIEEIDALITNKRGILLSSYYADCTPIILLDPKKKVVGLAHAGWKGTVKKIGEKTVIKMSEVYGSNPEDIIAGIGPTIGPCCYQVDERVVGPLSEELDYWKEVVEEDEEARWRLNLSLANKKGLEKVGVGSIIESKLCTSCYSELFFSYRRDGGRTGRMASLIKLK